MEACKEGVHGYSSQGCAAIFYYKDCPYPSLDVDPNDSAIAILLQERIPFINQS